MKHLLILFFTTLIACFNLVTAQEKIEKWEKYIISEKSKSADEGYYLLNVTDRPSRNDLINSGFQIVRELDQMNFIVRINNEQLSYSKKVSSYRLYSVNDTWKLSEQIDTTANRYSIKITSKEALSKLDKIPQLKVLRRSQNAVFIRSSYQTIIDHLLPISGVTYIGQEAVVPKEEARVLDLNLHPNHINVIHHEFPDLNGEGMRVSVKDQFYKTDDIDLINRHLASGRESSTTTNHATEMATVIAGAGNSFVNGKGVVWAANITSSDFNPVSPDDQSYYHDLDVWVQNHSYGTEIENFYGVLAESFDLSANQNPNLLHVFSSGNLGNETANNGAYQGIQGVSNITGNYKMSKNSLVVGAVDTTGNEMSFSSQGPAYDGRIKPELVAYSMAGTSSAAALVTGVATLLQQAYKQEHGQTPHSALIKGLLIHTAKDAGKKGIDYATGFGNMDAYEALNILLDKKFEQGYLSNGDIKNIPVQVPANSKNLTVTLIWNDPAAAPNDEYALVNDLDIRVSGNGEEWLPWILDAAPENISNPAVRGEDHLNNVEHITIEDPEEGLYTIEIKGFDISQGEQEYFVIYSFLEKDTFKWLNPTGSDNIPFDGEATGYLRWKSSFNEETGKLSYSTDNGSSWIKIDDDVDLSSGYKRWEAPDIFSKALVRMEINDDSFISDAFTISTPLTLNVGFNCGDSVMVNWDKIEGVTSYKLLTVGEKFTEELGVTPDSFYVYQKPFSGSSYVAVQPFIDSKRLLRSYMYDINLQGVGCYLKSFFSEVKHDEGINLHINLGTKYGVHQIIFERWNEDKYETIGIFQNVEVQNTFFDENPHEGMNIYRAIIEFKNGESITTSEISDFYLSEKPFIVYPNPVYKENFLNILSKEYEGSEVTFTLINQLGARVRSLELISNHNYIPLDGLPAGLYFYEVKIDQDSFKGKVLIHNN